MKKKQNQKLAINKFQIAKILNTFLEVIIWMMTHQRQDLLKI